MNRGTDLVIRTPESSAEIKHKISIDDITSDAHLAGTWGEIRKDLRALAYRSFYLASDPLEYASYQWAFERFAGELASEVRQNRYHPEQGRIFRVGKGNGLSRPQCYLTVRDLLLYTAITRLAERELLQGEKDWAKFKREDKEDREASIEVDFSYGIEWRDLWLRKQSHIARMLENPEVNFIVETDISNFFGSIQPEAVREHLYSQSGLDKQAARLCARIIEDVMPRPEYSKETYLGLPQEILGASRSIAHSLLFKLDTEFEKEGKQERYYRFMDDVTIGVKSIEQGQRCLSRFQRQLESIGLYINSAKTSIVDVPTYEHQILLSTNADLERIGNEIRSSEIQDESKVRQYEIPYFVHGEISELSKKHRLMADRPKRWDKVRDRLYRMQAISDIADWWDFWDRDIREDPKIAAAVLEFVRSWPLTDPTVESLVAISNDLSALYSDVPLLAAETVLTAPVAFDEDLWRSISNRCLHEFNRCVNRIKNDSKYETIASSWMLAAWKYGNLSQRQKVLDVLPRKSIDAPLLHQHGLPLIAVDKQDIGTHSRGASVEFFLEVEYLQALQSGNRDAVNIALNLLEPQVRLSPNRYMVLPRSIPLLGIFASPEFSRNNTNFVNLIETYLKKMKENPQRLRDHRVERILSDWVSL